MRATPVDAAAVVPPTPTWWQRGVVYQIYPRSFADSDGDGLGDLRGIVQKVDYLAWLGIDAVWMSPMYPTPDSDLGYDISDYVDVDPRLGSLADLDDLVAALHDRDIRLILDLVPNHTSDQHPWFVQSRSGQDDPRHDWYVWRDGRPDGSPPNNWESYFGGSAWTYLEPPGRWYLHSFDPGQPDLEWENREVRSAIAEVMRFWLDRGVDGFRVDVLWLLGKDPELRDNPPNPDWREGDRPWRRLLRAHSEDGPRAHEHARFLRSVLDEYEDRVMVGEVVLPAARAVAFHGERLDEAHLPHNFTLPDLPVWTAESIGDAVDRYESVLPPGAWPNWLLGDHDLPRVASRVGPERTRLAHLLLLTLRGTPTWYYGDELGLPNAAFPAGTVTSIDPQAATSPERDRLTVRTPMQWEPGPAAGFSAGEPWLPIASVDPALTVERQRRDPDSTLHYVRDLLRLRSETPALSVGTYRRIEAPPGVLSYERGHPDGTVFVHLNWGDEIVALEAGAGTHVLRSTHGAREIDGTTLTLAVGEGVILAPGP
ncbi:MAG TPA: alpha-amylase family glycosyl hydrolase [Actinomycetota bacterium]